MMRGGMIQRKQPAILTSKPCILQSSQASLYELETIQDELYVSAKPPCHVDGQDLLWSSCTYFPLASFFECVSLSLSLRSLFPYMRFSKNSFAAICFRLNVGLSASSLFGLLAKACAPFAWNNLAVLVAAIAAGKRGRCDCTNLDSMCVCVSL